MFKQDAELSTYPIYREFSNGSCEFIEDFIGPIWAAFERIADLQKSDNFKCLYRLWH